MFAAIDSHFAGAISPPAERRLRAHLPGCEPCRTYYERLALIVRLDPKGLDAKTRLRRGLGLAAPRARAWRVGSAIALVAAASALALWLGRDIGRPAGLTARGTPATGQNRLHVYRMTPGPPATLAGGAIGRNDRLAFAYENPARRKRLLVFGVDEHGHVYWFHPAWTDAASNPAAIPIAEGAKLRELPEAIEQDFDGRQLRIFGVFVDQPLTVRQVETELQRAGGRTEFIPGATIEVHQLRITGGS